MHLIVLSISICLIIYKNLKAIILCRNEFYINNRVETISKDCQVEKKIKERKDRLGDITKQTPKNGNLKGDEKEQNST